MRFCRAIVISGIDFERERDSWEKDLMAEMEDHCSQKHAYMEMGESVRKVEPIPYCYAYLVTIERRQLAKGVEDE